LKQTVFTVFGNIMQRKLINFYVTCIWIGHSLQKSHQK